MRHETVFGKSALAVAISAIISGAGVVPNANAFPLGDEFQVNTTTLNDQKRADVALDAAGNFVVVWQHHIVPGTNANVFSQRYDSDGAALGAEFQVNTTANSGRTLPVVAMDADGDFVVAWEDFGDDGSGYGIYAQRYNAAGVAQGGNFLVNTTTNDAQRNPDVAMDSDGDFVVVWEDQQFDGSKRRVMGQRFSAAGAPQGAELGASTDALIDHTLPRVAMDADGDFVVSWQSGNVGANQDVAVRRFDAAGNAQGAPVLVNGTTRVDNESQSRPNTSVAMNADGDFVVTWKADNFSGAGIPGAAIGIVGRHFDSAGVAVDAQFLVDDVQASTLGKPDAAMNADGHFIIAYRRGDASLNGVWAQRYSPDGSPKGEPLQANTFTSFNQWFPSVAIDASANAVVVWESNGNAEQDGDGVGVFGQRLAGTVVPKADIVIDFDSIGLWARLNDTSWLKLNNASPGEVVTGDIDGNGEDDVIAAFGSGIFVKRNLGAWAQLHNFVPELMAVGDLDNSGGDDLVVDFGSIGLWARMNDSSWLKLNNASPSQVIAGDMDGNGADDVIAVFPSGIFVKRNLGGWTQLHNFVPELMSVGDLDNNGADDLIVDFGAIALWAHMNDSSWMKLHNSSPELVSTGDLDGNGADDVLATFTGLGLWQKLNLGGWSALNNSAPEDMVTGDVTGNGKDDIIGDFGSTLGGIFVKRDQGAWAKLHNFDPDSLAAGKLDVH